MLNIKDIVFLENRSVIAISGDDRKAFLQGLITNNISKVSSKEAIFSAFLSPQGKFLYDFFIIENGEKLYLETDKNRASELIKRLLTYRLRAKVEIVELPELGVAVEIEKLGILEIDNSIKYKDPRLPELGHRIIFPISQFPNFSISNSTLYEQHRYSLGIPEGATDLVQNKSLPMEFHYDKLNAIDFNKGCYVGQEVTARSKHRATLHKQMFSVKSDNINLPPNGTIIMNGEREVGQMAGSFENAGLAVINIDAVNSGASLKAGGIDIKAFKPYWIEHGMEN
ncbi:MAG: hypothetical protein WCJ33_00510 [Pseudomonadota bacterium]